MPVGVKCRTESRHLSQSVGHLFAEERALLNERGLWSNHVPGRVVRQQGERELHALASQRVQF